MAVFGRNTELSYGIVFSALYEPWTAAEQPWTAADQAWTAADQAWTAAEQLAGRQLGLIFEN